MTPLSAMIDTVLKALEPIRFGSPVSHVYNPLAYARKPYEAYFNRYGKGPKEIVLLGMNPGPWGMAQTGVPFGDIVSVRDWLGIGAPVSAPRKLHPKRPVTGFSTSRREVSGKRLWGWAKRSFQVPDRFFKRFFVANYCPLMFIDADGRNRTPDHLRAAEKHHLFAVCDRALQDVADRLETRYVVGIGQFAARRAELALKDRGVTVGRATHPSPANPKANRGWEEIFVAELSAIGITV